MSANEWLLADSLRPDAGSIEKNGARFISANGHLGLRGTLDEHGAEHLAALIVNGLYDRAGDKWREPVNAPNPLSVRIRSAAAGADDFLDAGESEIERHQQGIDFRRGVQFRETVFLVPSGGAVARVTVRSRRFVSLASERLVCAELEIEADRELDLVVRAGIEGNVWDINGPHLRAFRPEATADSLTLDCRTGELDIPLRVALVQETADHGPTDRGPAAHGPAGFGAPTLVKEGQGVYREWPLRAGPLRRATLRSYAVIRDGFLGSVEGAAAEAASAAAAGFDQQLDLHSRSWEARWRRCEADIDGDEEARCALRFSLYQLLAAAPTFPCELSIPARGLSGQVYKGAIFWDTELFMLPFFSASLPDIARTLVKYRTATLDGARRKAVEYGYRGAYYAWESQEKGDDACTLFNVNDVFTGRPMRTFFRDKQIHISADVAWAVAEYVAATGDETILEEGGAEVVYECARFLASWLYWKPGRDRYEVLDVTGPDEYHERVNNDYYTNRMVQRTFSVCLEMDAALAEKRPDFRSDLIDSLDFASDLDFIRAAASSLYLAEPDPASSVIPQFDGYFGLEDVSIPDLLSRKLHDNEYLGGGNGLARWTRIIKQADVVLALILFPDKLEGPAGRRLLAANYAFYEPRTEHGSSLSACAYSTAAARLGKLGEAYDYFMKSARIDLDGDGKRWVGDLYIGGTHPAANGGAWIALARGFCGLRSSPLRLGLDPAIPDRWRSIVLRLGFAGRTVTATVSSDRVSLECDGPLPAGFTVTVGRVERSWDGGATLEIEYKTQQKAMEER